MIALSGVTYRYPTGELPALSELSLTIEPGELVLLAGASGSGKSTLLRLASGLVPHFYGGEFGGCAAIAGLDLRESGPAELARAVGFVAQDPETQVVMGSVRAELEFPLENRGHSGAQVARSVEEVALVLGIEQLLDRPTHELSGGELQRVALGAALVSRPSLLLLDEPTAQLDPVAGDELVSLLRRLVEQWGVTVVLAEHRTERCLAAADRVLVLEGGEVICDTTPQEFLCFAGERRPSFEPPAARLLRLAGVEPPPLSAAAARRTLMREGLELDLCHPERRERGEDPANAVEGSGRWVLNGRKCGRDRKDTVLCFSGVWHELRDGPAILRNLNLSVKPGERVVLMGRNGAGKSTLLRHAAGLMEPTRGRVDRSGRVALLLQHPGDYLVHERVRDEAGAEALERVGLIGLAERHPRDLSGGERQRLALATVLDSPDLPSVVCLDEPTRGMDRLHRERLVDLITSLSERGVAVVVATHDAEFAAEFAQRVVLLAEGTAIADGSPSEVLSGGWYFTTETARVLAGTGSTALTPEEGSTFLQRSSVGTEVLA